MTQERRKDDRHPDRPLDWSDTEAQAGQVWNAPASPAVLQGAAVPDLIAAIRKMPIEVPGDLKEGLEKIIYEHGHRDAVSAAVAILSAHAYASSAPASAVAAPDAQSQTYSWLERAAQCGIPEVRQGALTMMAYYQGADFPEPAQQDQSGHMPPVELTVERILQLVCDHTGRRISLNVEEVGQHIDFARAIEAEVERRCRAQRTNNDSDKVSRDEVLEEAAAICDAVESDRFDAYKGRGKYEPRNPARADAYVNGESDGAGQCAQATRALKSPPVSSGVQSEEPK